MGCSALSLMSRPSHRTTGNYSANDGSAAAQAITEKAKAMGPGIPRSVPIRECPVRHQRRQSFQENR